MLSMDQKPFRIKLKEGTFDSALDEDVAAEIKKMGYQVVPEVGCSGYRIDMGSS